jgi:hypothetical protein
MRRFALATLFSLGLLGPVSSQADTINYIESFTTSGTLNGTAFSSKLVTLTLTADTGTTAFFQDSSVTRYTNLILAASISVAGVGADVLTDSFSVSAEVYNTFGDFLVKDLTKGSDFFDTFTNATTLIGFDLAHPFGPVSGGAAPVVNTDFATSGGAFQFASVGGGVSTVAAIVPEPSSLLLSLLGLGGVLESLRRNRRVRLVR